MVEQRLNSVVVGNQISDYNAVTFNTENLMSFFCIYILQMRRLLDAGQLTDGHRGDFSVRFEMTCKRRSVAK